MEVCQHNVLGPLASLPALFLLLGDSGPLPVIIPLIVVRGSQFILILVGAEQDQGENLLPKGKHGTGCCCYAFQSPSSNKQHRTARETKGMTDRSPSPVQMLVLWTPYPHQYVYAYIHTYVYIYTRECMGTYT